MQPVLLAYLAIGFSLVHTCASRSSERNTQKVYCSCDSSKTNRIVIDTQFNKLPTYDTSSFDLGKFFVDDNINRLLWYRDVEHIGPTKFTALWNDYYPAAYHASHEEFVNHYQGKHDIELAFQFGPNLDLWAYHIFVVKRIECCFLVTRSYFRHARFTYKAYAIITGKKLDSLYSILSKINRLPIGAGSWQSYLGYFVDNRNGNSFFIELEPIIVPPKTQRQIKKEIQALFDFVDKRIHWKKTYRL